MLFFACFYLFCVCMLWLCFINVVGYNQQPPSKSTMRRDYYRGSQDSLADRAGLYRGTFFFYSIDMHVCVLIYCLVYFFLICFNQIHISDSPIDESRGISPGSAASALGRRGSYKTSRGMSTLMSFICLLDFFISKYVLIKH